MTNEWMETTEPGIYAIGDIVGGLPQLAHVGADERHGGRCQRSPASMARPVNRQRIPGLHLLRPADRLGRAVTEAQAKAAGHDVKVGKFPFVGNSKATILDSHDGFVKGGFRRQIR